MNIETYLAIQKSLNLVILVPVKFKESILFNLEDMEDEMLVKTSTLQMD